MNAHKLAATLMEDGILVLKGLPFHAGDAVEIIILEQPKEEQPRHTSPKDYPFQGIVLRYNDPLEPVVDKDYLDAVGATLTEWDSEADELAYQNLCVVNLNSLIWL
ncbi:hypothetical protein L3556_07685 [Candidatus Synechococcus calcipolaris G9]|uniref:Uncharacterized protein n=1 Tax=Candidatus Synechococcus calcipolaris G9 TaxID=1497997 RepID=A0ABT6EYC7_9SYNE|nr:hypothetical protein [Candidatus Synechococcus calcipolaris]MDG2990810.1 hypothetical protein [Candidatus Synechococcus calcipolaris G9]